MNIVAREDLYRRARELYGVDNQLEMVTEECGELVVALQHFKRPDRPNALVDLIDELADAQIMVEQARLILGAEEVDAAVERKLARLLERVAAGEVARAAEVRGC
jgi:NTP pyrophosphatase (non-canonical NTP hydrolase)